MAVLVFFFVPCMHRYAPGQQFKWHLDEVPPSMLDNGGQRLATTLVVLFAFLG
jgi:predicted 2-oxoglutarate/Fe(II)-dependent dioxygenase YbiX